MGWNDLESREGVSEDDILRAREVASMFRECFSTDAGKYVLNVLNDITDRPVLTADSTQFGAGIREGQNNLVRQIRANIKLAEEM